MVIHIKRKEKNINTKDTMTKIVLCRIVNFCLICIGLSYILAFIGREQIAESLSTAMVNAIIGTFVSYSAKSYFETRSERSLEFEKDKFDKSTNTQTTAKDPNGRVI